jgi:glycosyltransferase involved in cell wall biosynthesis
VKIAVFTSSYPRFPGDGTAPFIKSICENLVQLGHKVVVVAPYDPEVRQVKNRGVQIHRFRYIWPNRMYIMGHARALDADVRLRPLAFLLLPFYLLAGFIKLLIITGQHGSQAIHVHWVLPNGLVAAWVAALRKIPFILSLHGSDVFVAQRNPFFRSVARYVFRRAAGVTACSPELYQAALQLGAPPETRLLPWGANPTQFTPDFRTAEARKMFTVNPDRLLIVALGRLVHKKGFGTLLAAMPRIVDNFPQVHLLVGGEGPLRQQLSNQAAALGISSQVSFAGGVPWDRVPELLASADVFVLPSQRDEYGNVDGLPTVLLEAMSSGVAVVASEIGGVSLVLEDGRTGLIVPPGEPIALAQAVLTLVRDPDRRAAIGKAARQSVVERFNWESVAREIVVLLELGILMKPRPLRLGTIYRDEVLRILHKRPNFGRVLDVGCHDGYWLSTLTTSIRIGIDPQPISGAPGVDLVCADGRYPPFEKGTFDHVFALDVIEHIADDQAFARSLIQMIAPGGRLFISTPALHIRLTPPILTRWISKQWGHTLRLGYTAERLNDFFAGELDVQVTSWNAPYYRFYYLAVRLLAEFYPNLAVKLTRRIAQLDSRHPEGENGFYLLEGNRTASTDPIPLKR